MLDQVQIILGGLPIPTAEFLTFLREKGQEFTAATLPETVERGEPKQCFQNATLACLFNDELDYCEGVAFAHNVNCPGMAFLHAWCVDAAGNVVDPTWDDPEKCQYHGVRFPKDKYRKHIFRAKVYGVFGGANKSARKIFAKGGL